MSKLCLLKVTREFDTSDDQMTNEMSGMNEIHDPAHAWSPVNELYFHYVINDLFKLHESGSKIREKVIGRTI